MISGDFEVGFNRKGQVVVRLDEHFALNTIDLDPVDFLFSPAQARELGKALLDLADKAEGHGQHRA